MHEYMRIGKEGHRGRQMTKYYTTQKDAGGHVHMATSRLTLRVCTTDSATAIMSICRVHLQELCHLHALHGSHMPWSDALARLGQAFEQGRA